MLLLAYSGSSEAHEVAVALVVNGLLLYDNFESLRGARRPVTESVDWTGIGGRDDAERALEIDAERARAILEGHSKLLKGRFY